MAISKSISLLFILMCSLAYLGQSQGGDSLECVQKLLPCQPYLKGSSARPPPASCCVPLNRIVASDGQCLCKVFNDPNLLISLNVTRDDALNLAKSCGADAYTSICRKAAAPSTSPSTTPTAPSINSSATTPPPQKKNAAHGSISNVGVVSLSAIFFGLLWFCVAKF